MCGGIDAGPAAVIDPGFGLAVGLMDLKVIVAIVVVMCAIAFALGALLL